MSFERNDLSRGVIEEGVQKENSSLKNRKRYLPLKKALLKQPFAGVLQNWCSSKLRSFTGKHLY